MNAKRIIIAAGSCALAIAGILTVNANKKRTTVANLYYQQTPTVCAQISNSSVFTTTAGTPITFYTTGGVGSFTVYSARTSASTCNTGTAVSVALK